ncbi:MAG: HDOD domain-containing protein [Thiohalomonadaceae bacterium]
MDLFDQCEEALLAKAREVLARDRLLLPTLPEHSARIRNAIACDDVSLAELVRVIQSDPALTARILTVANSAMARRGREVRDLRSAVVRLGLGKVRSLANSLLLLQTLSSIGPPDMQARLRAIHGHIIAVGALSYALAAQTRHLDPEQAMIAGLIHDIGRLPLTRWVYEHPTLARFRKGTERLTYRLHAEIGASLLRTWGFPQHLVDVAAKHEQVTELHGADADYLDVVIVANLECRDTEQEGSSLEIDLATVPAYHKLGIRPAGSASERFIEHLRIGEQLLTA